MTFRLVGLMSVVLLISLTASALLMNYYQEQVMTEVAQTASQVGRETLRTLEFRGEGPISPVVRDLHLMGYPDGVPGGIAGEVDPPRKRLEAIGEGFVVFATSHARGEVVIKDLRDLTDAGELKRHIEVVPEDCEEVQAALELAKTEDAEGQTVTTVIRLDDVRAVEEADKGLYLRIPTMRAEGDVWVQSVQAGVMDVDLAGGAPVAVREEYRLQVPTGEYKELFSTMGRRSLYVFLGVFVLGTILSTGLATRFTRPVRRLDGAIRQLSDGDLDTRVQVRGGDEVARLGRAFNEMAGKLSANRDRARELTRREKLSALGRLAAGVAHDVRNPLHSIGLTLQHLQEACRPESPDRATEFDRSVGVIRDEIRRLDGLVENFLHFARTDRRDRIPTDLGELVRETARLLEKEAERRGVEIEVACDPDTPLVAADAESVRASVLNLALNSFEAMPDGGTLRIDVGYQAGEVVLEVRDTGAGIPEEDQERVFDFAYTTRDGGHGLGLAMVHQVVVEEHAGRVNLESRAGEGTRVTLFFPSGGLDEETSL